MTDLLDGAAARLALTASSPSTLTDALHDLRGSMHASARDQMQALERTEQALARAVAARGVPDADLDALGVDLLSLRAQLERRIAERDR